MCGQTFNYALTTVPVCCVAVVCKTHTFSVSMYNVYHDISTLSRSDNFLYVFSCTVITSLQKVAIFEV